MPITKVQEKLKYFSILFLHIIFNTKKKCLVTILKAINCKTTNLECLVPQDMREGRLSWNVLTFQAFSLRRITTALFVYSGVVSRHEDWFSSNFDGLSQKNKYIYQKTKCFGKLDIYQRLDLAKRCIKKCYLKFCINC